MKKTIIKAPARGIYKWRGFTLQKGAIYGTLHINGIKHAFVYLGQKRREIRADGTKAGWQMKIYLCQLENGVFYTKEKAPEEEFGWDSRWVNANSAPYKEIFATNPVIEWYKEPNITKGGERNILAYVPKQKNLGFIYSMVRERQ